MKRQMLASVNQSQLVRFIFTETEKKTQLNWEHEKEFEYQNEMYDVIKTEVHGDTTYYWCWQDREETELNRQLNHLVARSLGNNPQHQENKNRLLKFLESLYFSNGGNKGFFTITPVNTSTFYTDNLYRSAFQQLSVPPPEVVA